MEGGDQSMIYSLPAGETGSSLFLYDVRVHVCVRSWTQEVKIDD